MFVGIDDTDSPQGMCTTYLATKIIHKLKLHSTPHLIRLNPNIPYKTRGNAAISFRCRDTPTIRSQILREVTEKAHLTHPNTNPAVVFLREADKKKLKNHYLKAVSCFVTVDEAKKTAEKTGCEVHAFGNHRGIVGALAAVGCPLEKKTYELLAYREKGTKGARKIDVDSVKAVNKKFFPKVFDCVAESGRILITPRGADPVFCGIRGTSKKAVIAAWKRIVPLEPTSYAQVFVTNQATDDHIRRKKISQIRPFDCVETHAKIISPPKKIRGGHVLFRVRDFSSELDVAAYKPTGQLNQSSMLLEVGDEVILWGCVGKHDKTLNLERMKLVKPVKKSRRSPVFCCGRQATSTGRSSKLKCRVCGRKYYKKYQQIPRQITAGYFEASPSARRHLSKPLVLF